MCLSSVGADQTTGMKYYGADLGLDSDGVYVHYVEATQEARQQGIGHECLLHLV